MKFILLFITVTFAFLFSNIYALDVRSSLNTNAKRIARGLPPLAPRRRATPVYGKLLTCRNGGFLLTESDFYGI